MISDIQTKLLLLVMSLDSVQKFDEAQWESLGLEVTDATKEAIVACKDFCEAFMSELVNRSYGGESEREVPTMVGIFKGKQIEALLGELNSYKVSLGSDIDVAKL